MSVDLHISDHFANLQSIHDRAPQIELHTPDPHGSFMQGAQAIGDFLTEALGNLLEKTVKGGMALAGKGALALSGAVAAVGNAAAVPFNTNMLSAASSFMGKQGGEISSPGKNHGLAVASNMPAQTQSKEISPHHVSEGQTLGQADHGLPNVAVNKSLAQSRSGGISH